MLVQVLKPIDASFNQPVSAPPISDDLSNNSLMLQAVMESFVDGVILVTDRGQVIQANARARQICDAIHSSVVESCPDPTKPDVYELPKEIWRVCQALMESSELFPDQKVISESKVNLQDVTTLRIRVKWLELEMIERSCLLVTLEDRSRMMRDLAIADQYRYGLSPRQREIWQLRLQGYTYRKIAAKLHISHNTVKKHLQNIFIKRQDIDELDPLSQLSD